MWEHIENGRVEANTTKKVLCWCITSFLLYDTFHFLKIIFRFSKAVMAIERKLCYTVTRYQQICLRAADRLSRDCLKCLIWRDKGMAISYNGLWKIMIDKKLQKKDLIETLNISSSTIAKMGKGEAVSINVLERICEYLDCNIGDVMSFVKKSG